MTIRATTDITYEYLPILDTRAVQPYKYVFIVIHLKLLFTRASGLFASIVEDGN